MSEKNYLSLLQNIIENGVDSPDRTGVGTLSIFGTIARYSLENNQIPLLTTRKMFFRGIVEELLFFIRGETNTKLLEEKGINIWKGNTSRQFLDKINLSHYPEGEMGPMYGFQWRSFGSKESPGKDQLQEVFELIKSDPNSRRLTVTAFNPNVTEQSVLYPCHMFFQFYVKNKKLSCLFYQRSVDYMLGNPFNIVSYAVLTHLFAKALGLEAGELVFMGGDTHVYKTHLEGAKELLTREPLGFPRLKILKDISSIEDMENLSYEDFLLEDYKSHGPIKMEMAV
jgi:thymidylate synthase